MENRRKAEAPRQQAEKEKLSRAMKGSMHKAREAHCRALEQEMRWRQAEREAKER